MLTVMKGSSVQKNLFQFIVGVMVNFANDGDASMSLLIRRLATRDTREAKQR